MIKLKKLSSSSVRLITGAILLTMGCVIGIWDYAQQSLTDFVYEETPCEPCNEPRGEDLPSDHIDQSLEIKKGDTFASVLKRAGLSQNHIFSIVKAIRTVFNPKDLRTDHKVFVTFKPTSDDQAPKEITKLVIQLSLEQDIIVTLSETGVLQASKLEKELVHDYRHAGGVIENSLYVDAIKQGAHPKIIHEMIQAFSYDVDFQRGFREGDSYSLLFDYYKDPESLLEKPGQIIFAKLSLHGKDVCVYRHKHKNGSIQFFNEKGEAVKKGLLMTPVDGARISSGFGRRKHPILGYTKMHKGVDFAAPRGTPIMAAGAGKVIKIGRLGAYGNYIRIRHNNRYDTAYAHMCRFAKNLKRGSAVRQGQIIGYVGCTGRATGNHLHYELLQNGKQVNPKHVKMMPASKLSGHELQRFLANKAKIDERVVALKADQNSEESPVLNIARGSPAPSTKQS